MEQLKKQLPLQKISVIIIHLNNLKGMIQQLKILFKHLRKESSFF